MALITLDFESEYMGSNQNVNIAFMRLFREGKGKTAYSVVESDERIPDEILEEIRQNPYVQEILLIQI